MLKVTYLAAVNECRVLALLLLALAVQADRLADLLSVVILLIPPTLTDAPLLRPTAKAP